MDEILAGLSEVQKQAATTYGKDLVVRAGAGAGKTRVLVSRYLYFHLELGWDLDQILAITFTEKAAAEMQDRVRAKMLEFGRDPSGLDTAYISTFHSFCLRMLKEYPALAGLDPEFGILDELRAKVLLYQAIKEVISTALTHDPPDPHVARLITDLAGGIPSHLVPILASAFDQWQGSGLELAEIIALTMEADWSEAQPIQERLEQTVQAISSKGAEVKGKSRDKIVELEEAWAAVGPIIMSADSTQCQEMIRCCSSLGECKSTARAVKEDFVQLHQAVKELQGLSATIYTFPILEALKVALEQVHSRYSRAKAKENALDFTDLMLKGRELFRRPEVSAALRSRFKAVMVDEFQDTNGLQKELIDLIRAEDALFVVGDPKQSIYRFRGAEVEVFAETAAEICRRCGRVVDLAENYRSRGELLSFCNTFFPNLFLPQGPGAISYTEIKNMRPKEEQPRVELLTGFNDEDSATNRTTEAQALAYRIYEMVGSGEQLVNEVDRTAKTETPRAVRYGDIAVLFRSRSDIDIYYSALQQMGIPVVNLAGSDFFLRLEIKDILACLKAIADPEDEYSLAVTLRSPLFSLSDPELWQLKQEYGSFAKAVAAPDDAAPQGLREATALIRDLAPLADRMGPVFFVDKVLERTGYPWVVRSGLGGEQGYANLRKFQEMVEDLERAGLSDLGTFLDYVNELIRTAGKENEAQLASEGEGAVRLMTIHSAKGLEFKVVFVVDGSRGITWANFQAPAILFDKVNGFGFKFHYGGAKISTHKYDRIVAADQLADYEEAKRIFYVAVTRAEDYLVLSGILKKDRSDKLETVNSAGNWLEWFQALSGKFSSVLSRDIFAFLEEAQKSSGEAAPAEEPALTGEVPADPPPQPIVDWEREPISVGVSDLLTLDSCPRQFYYRRILGLPQRSRLIQPGAEDTAAVSEAERVDPIMRGNLAHLACAQLTPDTNLSPFITSLAGELGVPQRDRERLVAEVTPLITAYQESDLFRRLFTAAEIISEEPFLVELAGLMVRGTFDKLALFPEGKGLLIDFKTNWIDRRQVTEKTAYYGLQLQLYAAAVRELYGTRLNDLEVGIYYLVPGVYQQISRLGMAEMESRLRGLKGYLVPGKLQDYPGRTEACKMCTYSLFCCQE